MKEVILCSFAVVLAAGAYLLTADKTSEGALLLSNVEALTRVKADSMSIRTDICIVPFVACKSPKVKNVRWRL